MWCVKQTRIQDSRSLIRLTFPSSPSVNFHLHISEDPEAAASGIVGIGVAFSERAEVSLLQWILVDSRLLADLAVRAT